MQEKLSKDVMDIGAGEFQEKVVLESHRRPVLVDFWAPWCAPCRMLSPLLEKLADDFKGAFLLAKVNTEQEPELARQFRIQSIPRVILFRDGEAVDHFVGALPEAELRRFIRRHCQTAADTLVAAGRAHLEKGELESARGFFGQALSEEPKHPGALLGMAGIAKRQGQRREMLEWLEEIDPISPEAEAAELLRVEVRFDELCREAGGLEACRQRVAEDPLDLDSRYRLGCCLAARGEYREALETLLGVVAEDRNFADEAPRKAMLDIFNLVGVRSPLADEFRTRLSRTIF